MSTHDTPRTSCSIVAVDGNGLTLGNISRALSNSDVGRLIIMTTGNARQQVRKITQIVSNNQITIDHPFNEAAFPWITEVNPVLGDLCVFSYRITDLDPGDNDIDLSSNNLYTISNLELDGGAYIHMENVDLRFNSATFEIRSGGGLILGWYVRVADEPARPINSCSLRDSVPNSGGDSMRRTLPTASFGMYQQYGGEIYVPAECFWRLYQDTPDVDVRFIDVNIKGGFGARVDGTNSILIATTSNNTAPTGLFNPRSAVAYSAVSAIKCLQIGYVWLREGASGKFTATDAVDLDRGFRIFTSGGGAGQVFRIEGKKDQFDQFGIVYWAQGGDAFGHAVRFVNEISPSFVNQDTTAHLGTIKTHLEDTNDVVIAAGTQTIQDGQFDDVEGIYCEWVTKNNGQGSQNRRFTDPDTIVTAPYEITATAWGKVPLVQTISLEDTFDAQLTLLDDPTLTETDKAVVDAYQDLDTAEKLYDAAMSWQADNPHSVHGLRRFGKTLDFGDVRIRLFREWQPNTEYDIGDDICYQNVFYNLSHEVTLPYTSGDAFNLDDWNVNADNPTSTKFANAIPNINYNIGQFGGSQFQICLPDTLDANIITTDRIILNDESRILGTIKDSTGVRLRLTLPIGSVIKGYYTPPGGAETAIPFEALATGTKIIKMPANSAVTLYSKSAGKVPRVDRFNVGDNGISLTPEQARMNGTVSAQPWTAAITSTAVEINNNGLVELTFSSLDNFAMNADGVRHLTADDAANFVDRVHFLENYATISLNSLAADHIISGANRQIICEASYRFVLADALDEDLLIEITFERLDPAYTLERPRTATNKRQVWIALNLVDNANPLSGQDIRHIIESSLGDDVDDLLDGMAVLRETTTSNATNLGTLNTTATTITMQVEELAENQEIEHLVLVKNLKPLPAFHEGSVIHDMTAANGVVKFSRTGGNAPDELITYANLPEAQRFTIGGEAGATDFVMFIRNPGTHAETLTINLEFHIAGSSIPDTNRQKIITLEPSGAYQSVIFNVHGIHNTDLVERIQLGIAGMGLGAAGGLEILELSAHRVGTPEDDGAVSREAIMTQLRMIQTDVTHIVREVG